MCISICVLYVLCVLCGQDRRGEERTERRESRQIEIYSSEREWRCTVERERERERIMTKVLYNNSV